MTRDPLYVWQAYCPPRWGPGYQTAPGGDRARGLAQTERDRRAVALLLDILTPEQHTTYNESGYVVVPSRVHKLRRWYIACWLAAHNIYAVDKSGRMISRRAAYPVSVSIIPVADSIASIVLTLRHREKFFLEKACGSDFYGPGDLILPPL